MTTAIQSYEDLRQRARRLENDIDLKLVAFSKLGAGLLLQSGGAGGGSSIIAAPSSAPPADTVPLLGAAPDDVEDTFTVMSMEIDGLLGQLRTLNDQMGEQPVSGSAMLHTVHRHRDILRDLSRDFEKTVAQKDARRERQELLRGEGAGATLEGRKSFREGINNRRDLYLKENQHIHSSDRLVNEQISIAMETREHLVGQRHTFKKLQTRFNDISNKYPLINSLVQRINLKRRRDSIILGLVISGGTLLVLFYLFH